MILITFVISDTNNNNNLISFGKDIGWILLLGRQKAFTSISKRKYFKTLLSYKCATFPHTKQAHVQNH
jgi:hypothetical protein